MKKLFLALLITQLILLNDSIAQSSLTNNFDAVDQKNGFRDLHFGIPKDSVKNLVLTEGKGDEKYYKKTDDKLKLGDYLLKSISYNFYKGKLCSVIIQTKGYLNSRGVLSILTEQYGPGFQSNKYIEEYAWLGQIETIIYDENALTKDANIIFSNREIEDQKEADQKLRNQKAKSDL